MVKDIAMDGITISDIISIIGLVAGGGSIGTFFTWRWQRKRARAEAKQAEAQAEQAKFEAMQANSQLIKDIQDSYQRLTEDLKANLDTQQEYNEEQKQYIAELKEDRRHLREERDDLRNRQDKLEKTMRELQRDVDRNCRMVESMRPLLCGREGCAIRVPVAISPSGEIDKTHRPQSPVDGGTSAVNDIDPYNGD